MSQQFALLLLQAITAIGTIVWLVGLTVLVAASRSDLLDSDQDGLDRLDDDPTAPDSGAVVTGTAEVDGEPAALSSRAAAVLARMGSSGMLKLIERTDRRVAFEGTGLFPALGLGRRCRVSLDFRSSGRGRTRISYRARTPRGRVLIWLGGLLLAAGLVALAGGYWAMSRYIVPSPNLGIRSQVVQMVQVVHVLWPPFLLAYLHRRPRTMLRAQLDALVHNLPYLDPEQTGPARMERS